MKLVKIALAAAVVIASSSASAFWDNDNGYYNSNLLLVETERAMMKAADEVVIVADSTKFGRTSLARMCELHEANALVVDNEISDEWKTKVTDSGVKLIVANAGEKK